VPGRWKRGSPRLCNVIVRAGLYSTETFVGCALSFIVGLFILRELLRLLGVGAVHPLAHGDERLPLWSAAPVAGTYHSYEELRRHPNSIVIFKTYLDLLFAVLLIIEQAVRAGGGGSAIRDYCGGFSFFFELLLIGSELCFLLLSYDLYAALHNPFVDYKSSFRRYLVVVGVVAIIMAASLVGSNRHGASAAWPPARVFAASTRAVANCPHPMGGWAAHSFPLTSPPPPPPPPLLQASTRTGGAGSRRRGRS